MVRPLPNPPVAAPRKLSTSTVRHAACTHISMTRIYDINHILECQLCRRHPSTGWLYRCTQDHGGYLPESDFIEPEEPFVKKRNRYDDRLDQISPHLVKAIEAGQYIEDQVNTLILQKEGVRRAILTESTQSSSSSSSSEDLSDMSKIDEDNTFTTISSIMTLEDELGRSESRRSRIKQSVKSKFREVLEAGGVLPRLSVALQSPDRKPPCSFMVCATCRPTFRDRAFVCIDALFDEDQVDYPPEWELYNRPVSDARVVAQLGLPKLGRVKAHQHRDQFLDGPWFTYREEKQRNESRTRSGFRATVRKALQQAIEFPRSSSALSQTTSSTSDSDQGSLRGRLGKSMLFRRSKPRTSSRPRSRPVDDSILQDSINLMIAMNTPLPEAAEDPEDLEGSEIEVEGGLAFTEEGVGLSSADIIVRA